MAEHAFQIAAHARRFALLADRPDLLYPEAGQRAERVLSDDTKSPLDVMLIGGASEADCVCASAVAMLRQERPSKRPILTLLSVLPAENLLGIYHALPVEWREQCEGNEVWAHALRHAPQGIEAAEEVLRELAELDESDVPEQILEGDEAWEFRQLTDQLLRESLGVAGDGG